MKTEIGRRVVATSGVVGLAAGLLTVAGAGTADAASGPTTLFSQSFTTDQILPASGAIAFPAAPTSTNNPNGINSACLTVAQTSSSPLPNCATTPDSSGSGALQLTANSTAQEGGIFAATSVPASQGLDLKFDTYQYGGDGADGIAFVLAAVDPTNPLSPRAIGQAGGSLGYSAQGSSLPGLSDGYLGIGIDAWGNFSRDAFGGTGCPTDPTGFGGGTQVPNHVTVRGPGHDSVGYCGLVSSSDTEHLDVTGANGGTRANSHIPVEVVINTTGSAFTTTNGSSISVPAGNYAIIYKPIGASSWDELSGPLPSVTSTYYGSETSSWIDSNGIPRQLAFGWVASTGGSKDTHEVNNVQVTSINPVPKLSVDQTIQDVATAPSGPTKVAEGDPVTYTVNPSVDSTGADENQPITVTDTLPTGVTPTSAGGAGWVCDPPSGQKISCTNSNVPFAAGTDLPPITVNGTVTDPSGVDESTIETNSVTTASSPDADPAYTAQATSAAPATALANLAIDPTIGMAGAAATLSSTTGEDLSGVSQVSVGSTYLAPCTSGPAASCFTYDSTAGDIEISSMPAHALGAATVAVVDGGALSNAMSYTYVAAPDAPAVTATAHDNGHTTIDWTPGATNGSTVTSWTVTPLLADGSSSGIAAATVADPSTTTYDFAGLTKGTSYKFDVVAHTSDAGDSAAGESNTVTPPLDLSLTTTSLDSGEVNLAGYSQTLTSSGGTGPDTWTATGLPAGLALSTAGVLSGTPTAAFAGTVSITVTDADGATSERDLALTIAADPSVTTTSLPAVVVNHLGYTQTLAVSDGVGPFSWAVTTGSLPAGLTLDPSTGVISGTPTLVGTSTFTVTVTDANGLTATSALTLSVNVPPPTVPDAPTGTVDTKTAHGDNPTATATDTSHGNAALTVAGTGNGDLRVSTLGPSASGISTTDPAITGPTAGGIYNVELGTSQSLTTVALTIHGTPSSSIYWWDGAAWQKVPGVTRNADGDLVANLTATSVPSLAQLSNATFAAGATPLTRIAGATRIETAVAASKAEFPNVGSATAVVLARDDLFADALTGGPLAAAKNAPLLLTDTHSLLAPVVTEIVRVLPKGGTVYLLGDTQALDASVAAAVTSHGYHAVRVGGVDRYGTSVQIAGMLGNPTTVFEATGLDFPDAVSAGPAAIQAHGAVLLTADTTQPKVVANYLEAHEVSTRYAIGGQAADADTTATRLVGSDRYGTAAKVAATFFDKPKRVGLATGENFADALVAAPGLGRAGQPLLLTSATATLPAAVASYLTSNADTIASAAVYGGTTAVSAALAGQLQTDTP
ncbi:MAG: cell wall-binding repeat-containing protein [Acidothermaceae bacterium]